MAFGGVGRADREERAASQEVGAGRLGARYLIARTYGLHIGFDVASVADDPVLCVIVGSAWLRP